MTCLKLEELGLNSKLNLNTSSKKTILETTDIISIIKFMLDLRDGKGDVDDIDHLGNRRVRSVGELVENQFKNWSIKRMERTVKEKMSTFLEIESAMPQDLINAKPITTSSDFFATSQLFTNLWIKQIHFQKLLIKKEFLHWVQVVLLESVRGLR